MAHKRDRWTDGQTDRQPLAIAIAELADFWTSVSRGKLHRLMKP